VLHVERILTETAHDLGEHFEGRIIGTSGLEGVDRLRSDRLRRRGL
jgi:hypothetical protein